jgi:NADH:ubiquinone oxidoreductase subunit C
MDPNLLKQKLQLLLPDITFAENSQYPELLIPSDQLHEFCSMIKTAVDLKFDYLISETAVDWNTHFMMVYHITSTEYRHVLVVKSRIDDRQNPLIDTVSDLWKTAEFHEREVFDLFGIVFRNHPDLTRLFLEDGYGFPLRKDFTDESRMIVK